MFNIWAFFTIVGLLAWNCYLHRELIMIQEYLELYNNDLIRLHDKFNPPYTGGNPDCE